MKYVDTGSRDPDSVLGNWLKTVLNDDVSELRWQAGFFSAGALGLFAPSLKRLASTGGVVRTVVGSNEAGTIRDDILQLARLIGIPRKNADLAVVSYSGAFYHPKTYHIRRADGTQAAYVGSANLTPPAMNGLHIEAGILLDSRSGDPDEILDEIAGAVDAWFQNDRAGRNEIAKEATIDELLAAGVLCITPPPRAPKPPGESGKGGTSVRPRLKPLLSLPGVAADEGAETALIEHPTGKPAVPRSGFPAYLLFDPETTVPTYGSGALSGAALPSGAVGLIVQLNRDSARHFDDRTGTANLSVPVATLSSIRFGIFAGKYRRPRAEFRLRIRYLTSDSAIELQEVSTNIMAYGFAPGESGHGDVRLLMPAVLRGLAESIRAQGAPVPTEGDLALLEWPTAASPVFRLTYLDSRSSLFGQVRAVFEKARASDQLVGDGACWLMPNLAPAW